MAQSTSSTSTRGCAFAAVRRLLIALANRPRTRCHDGAYRPRLLHGLRTSASRNIEDGALVRGGISTRWLQGFGTFGLLIAQNVRQPAGPSASGSFYRLRDVGVRCVREPCFSIRGLRLNDSASSMFSGLDLRSAELTTAQHADATAAAYGPGLLAVGHRIKTDEGGRVFRATRLLPQSAVASRLSTSQARRTSSSVVRKLPIARRSTKRSRSFVCERTPRRTVHALEESLVVLLRPVEAEAPRARSGDRPRLPIPARRAPSPRRAQRDGGAHESDPGARRARNSAARPTASARGTGVRAPACTRSCSLRLADTEVLGDEAEVSRNASGCRVQSVEQSIVTPSHLCGFTTIESARSQPEK